MLTRRQSVALELESARADIQRLTAQLKTVTDERDALQLFWNELASQMKEQQGIVHRLEANDKRSVELVKHLELQLSSIKADNDRLSAELQSAREQVASMQESAAQLSSIKAANDAVIADIKANFEKLNIELAHAVAQSNVCFIVITISN